MTSIVSQVYTAIKRWVTANQLLSGIISVIIITLILTTINMALYITSGASGLDLSRPGFDAARDKVSDQNTPSFSSAGKLTPKDIEAFTKLYNAQRDKLRQIGSFDDQALTDESLGLVMPSGEPVPGNE